jgi:hypothetical protein
VFITAIRWPSQANTDVRLVGRKSNRTRTNTNPNGTKAKVSSRMGVRERSTKSTYKNRGAWAAKSLAKRDSRVGVARSRGAKKEARDLRNTKMHHIRGQKRPFRRTGRLVLCPWANAPTGQELLLQPQRKRCPVRRILPVGCFWPSRPFAIMKLAHTSSIRRQGRRARSPFSVTRTLSASHLSRSCLNMLSRRLPQSLR